MANFLDTLHSNILSIEQHKLYTIDYKSYIKHNPIHITYWELNIKITRSDNLHIK